MTAACQSAVTGGTEIHERRERGDGMESEGSWRRRGGMARQLKNKCIHYSMSCEWGSRARWALQPLEELCCCKTWQLHDAVTSVNQCRHCCHVSSHLFNLLLNACIMRDDGSQTTLARKLTVRPRWGWSRCSGSTKCCTILMFKTKTAKIKRKCDFVVVGSLRRVEVCRFISNLIINLFNKRSYAIPSLLGFINITVIGFIKIYRPETTNIYALLLPPISGYGFTRGVVYQRALLEKFMWC